MERKKKAKGNYPEYKNGVRIWPGVLVITVFACLVFLLVSYLGVHAGLLTMPGFLQSFISGQQDEAEYSEKYDGTQNLQSGLTAAETEYSYYRPEDVEPTVLLNSLRAADSFHQRMRFTVLEQNGGSKNWVANLYTAETRWRIEQENTVYISDGEYLWRSNTNGYSYLSETGTFTWNNQLGIPSLEELQAYGELNPDKVDFRETERTVHVEYQPSESSLMQCYIAVDTGLVTEMQVYVNGKQVLFMYTERISVSPDICEDMELFTWADKNKNG